MILFMTIYRKIKIFDRLTGNLHNFTYIPKYIFTAPGVFFRIVLHPGRLYWAWLLLYGYFSDPRLNSNHIVYDDIP